MNLSELARRLRVNTEELRDRLPELGYDVGRKAIKIPDQVAWKIINDWGRLRRGWEAKKREAREEVELAAARKASTVATLPAVLTVREFASLLGLPVTRVISELMKNGILAALNERIDFSTASIIAEDLGFQVQPAEGAVALAESMAPEEDLVVSAIAREVAGSLVSRPPVVVVMGHVDHGKTTLLDMIRSTNVVAREAGGITQHIGAYQTERKGRKITFIDTPGHEAFTTMRSRGARVADIAILVVAADDGVQPQTLEALKIIQATKVPYAVAVNKMDKPSADPERVKRGLSDHGVVPEEWGGTVPFVSLSAKTGTGIDALLDVVLILADLSKDKIVGNPDGETLATVIESHLDDQEGVVATALVQNGTLRRGDTLGVRGVLYGRVRAMRDWASKDVEAASPGMPVKLLGLKAPPEIGEVIVVSKDPRSLTIKKLRAGGIREALPTIQSSEGEEKKFATVNVVLKADVLGSLEALTASLEKLEHPEVHVKVITKGLGNITEADIYHAEAGVALVYGFNVGAAVSVADLAHTKNVTVRTFKIIYELLDDVRKEMEGRLAPEVTRTVVGRIKVMKVFRAERTSTIVGGRVEEGRAIKGFLVTIGRAGASVGTGTITELQSGKQPVDEVKSGSECGLKIEGRVPVGEGDILEVIQEEKKMRKLESS